MSRKRITSIDVARLAGVSQPTVSRAFTPNAAISDELRRRVYEAAERLGYQPNAIARSLITSQSHLVAVVIGDLGSPYEPYLLNTLSDALRATGRHPLLVKMDPHRPVRPQVMDILGYQVDGVIVIAGSVTTEIAEACLKLKTPLVVSGRTDLPDTDAVASANAEGAEMVAGALAAAGHRRIAYISGRPTTPSDIERREGFQRALARLGLPPAAVVPGDYSHESGRRAAVELIRSTDPPDVLFCGNDAMAFGALDAVRLDLGLTVPGDVSIIGFDDVPAAAWPSFDLTTVRQPMPDIVANAIELLERRIETPDAPPEARRLPCRLVRRGTARLRG